MECHSNTCFISSEDVQYLRTQSTYDVLILPGFIQIHIFMSVADKAGAFEVLLVPRYYLFAPKHSKWPTNGRSSPNGRNTRYSPGPNWVWDHSAHPMGSPVPHLWGSIARLFRAERPKTPFWALFALPPRAVAGDHFYGLETRPTAGTLAEGSVVVG